MLLTHARRRWLPLPAALAAFVIAPALVGVPLASATASAVELRGSGGDFYIEGSDDPIDFKFTPVRYPLNDPKSANNTYSAAPGTTLGLVDVETTREIDSGTKQVISYGVKISLPSAKRSNNQESGDFFNSHTGGTGHVGHTRSASGGKPSSLNFAICGTLEVGDPEVGLGTAKIPTCLGQGNDGSYNNWWYGGSTYNAAGSSICHPDPGTGEVLCLKGKTDSSDHVLVGDGGTSGNQTDLLYPPARLTGNAATGLKGLLREAAGKRIGVLPDGLRLPRWDFSCERRCTNSGDYQVSAGQPWAGVDSEIGTRKLDKDGSKSVPMVETTAWAGRHRTNAVAQWFTTQTGTSANIAGTLTNADSPDSMNLAYCGKLHPKDTDLDSASGLDLCLGQGSKGGANNWWIGGKDWTKTVHSPLGILQDLKKLGLVDQNLINKLKPVTSKIQIVTLVHKTRAVAITLPQPKGILNAFAGAASLISKYRLAYSFFVVGLNTYWPSQYAGAPTDVTGTYQSNPLVGATPPQLLTASWQAPRRVGGSAIQSYKSTAWKVNLPKTGPAMKAKLTVEVGLAAQRARAAIKAGKTVPRAVLDELITAANNKNGAIRAFLLQIKLSRADSCVASATSTSCQFGKLAPASDPKQKAGPYLVVVQAINAAGAGLPGTSSIVPAR